MSWLEVTKPPDMDAMGETDFGNLSVMRTPPDFTPWAWESYKVEFDESKLTKYRQSATSAQLLGREGPPTVRYPLMYRGPAHEPNYSCGERTSRTRDTDDGWIAMRWCCGQRWSWQPKA